MPALTFLFDENSIAGLALTIVGLAVLFYLSHIPQKSRATLYFTYFFAGITCFFLARFFTMSTSWHPVFYPLQVLAVVYAMLTLSQFALFYPQQPPGRAQRGVLMGFSVLLVVTLGLSIHFIFQLAFRALPSGQMPGINQFFDLALPGSMLITTLLIFQQAVSREGRGLRGLLRPQNPAAAALRDFGLAMLLAFLPALADPLREAGWITAALNNYLINFGLLGLVLILFLVYVNHTSDPTSISSRLVIISLSTILAILGLVGLIITDHFLLHFEQERREIVSVVQQGLPAEQIAMLPPEVSYVLARPLQPGAAFAVRYASAALPPEFLQQAAARFAAADGELFAPQITAQELDRLRAQDGQPAGEPVIHFLGGHPLAYSHSFAGYRFTQSGVRYEVGFDRLAYKRQLHAVTLRQMWLVLFSSLFIILIFPRLFSVNILNPLTALLSGMRQANAGNLDAYIPVQYEDEIGYLTHSFNTMLAAVRQTNQELEARVQERTAELTRSEEKYRNVIERSNDGIAIVQDWRLRYCNPQLAAMTGYTQAALLDQPFADFLAPEDAERARERHARRLRGEEVPSRYEAALLMQNGQTMEVEINASLMDYQGRTATLIFVREIGERKRAQRLLEETNVHLKRLSVTDSLTGLYNRRYFFERAEYEFERAIRYGTPLSALMLDVDHFKSINDTHGHLVGDQVLQQIAVVCSSALRSSDLFGRYGGEEFVLLLPETLPQGALELAERLRELVEQMPPVAPEMDGHPLSISLGVACLTQDNSRLEDLLNLADQALYRAKQAGRNRVAL